MKGGLPLATSPSRVSSTFLAETLPWVIFLSSWGGEKHQDHHQPEGPGGHGGGPWDRGEWEPWAITGLEDAEAREQQDMEV